MKDLLANVAENSLPIDGDNMVKIAYRFLALNN